MKHYLALFMLSFSATAFTQIAKMPKIDDTATVSKEISKSGILNTSNEENNGNSLIVHSIQNNHNELLINESISLKKGDSIQVFLPSGKDFMFIKKKSGFNTKLLGAAADIIGTAATAVGMGSGNLNTINESIKVVNAANAVHYGMDALEQIQDLPISKDAKKIAGKKMEIIDWEFTDDGWMINTKLENKKYQIYLQEAAIAGEVKL